MMTTTPFRDEIAVRLFNSITAESDTGWTYCLEDLNGEKIKIGMTTCKTIKQRYRGRVHEEPRKTTWMILKWAMKGVKYERLFHHLLSYYRLNLIPTEAVREGRVSFCERTCHAWIDKGLTPMATTMTQDEMFAIPSEKAIEIIISNNEFRELMMKE